MAMLRYPNLLNNEVAFPASIFFAFYNRRSTKFSSLTDTIMLYMPEEFGQPSTVQWDTFSATQAVVGGLDQMFGGGGGKKGGMGLGLGLLRQYTTPGSNLSNLAGAITGTIPNPYLTQIFRGVNFRNFKYTFRFVPFHEEDCDTIQEIINTFRKWSLPEGPAGAGSPLLNYPGECEIEYKWAGGQNPFIHKFKRCVITNIDVNYTGSGMWSLQRNGFPAETVLSITFSEIEIVVRNDVELNY